MTINEICDEICTYSFDIFDTLITRTTATPRGIFALIENTLKNDTEYSDFPDYLKDNFYMLRVNAEEHARMITNFRISQDVTLEQIYGVIALNYFLSDQQKEKLKNLELQTEIQNIVGIDQNISRIKDLLKINKKIILISDMYLTEHNIRNLLLTVDPIFSDIKIYVSSELKKTKASGELYKMVKAIECLDFDNWLHIGDNWHSDILAARNFGIKAEHYSYVAFEHYENKAIEKNEKDVFTQITIGSSKNTRLLKRFDEMGSLGASIGGVMIYPYVQWILQQSLNLGLKRLYFIARDGYVLKEIADIIIEKNNYDIQTKYVYGSRKAWRTPSLDARDDLSKINWHFNMCESPDIKALLDNLELTPNEVFPFLPAQYHCLDKKLEDAQIREIMNILSENADFNKKFLEKCKCSRNFVSDYLKQEIDFTDENFAFVELRGTGATQDCLAKIINKFYDKRIISFFFNLDRETKNNNIKYMMFPANYRYFHDLIEALTRAPHGQTIGYKNNGNELVPILEQVEGMELVKIGYLNYIDGVKCFSKRYTELLAALNIKGIKIDLFCDYHDFLTNNPDLKTAELIGSVPFKRHGPVDEVQEFAPAISIKEAIEIYYLKNKYYNRSWYQGSYARTSKFCKNLIKYSHKYNNTFNPIFSARINRRKNLAFIKFFGIEISFKKLLGWQNL